MNVSLLIEQLTKFLDEHGDLDVWVYNYQCSGHYGCLRYEQLDDSWGVRLGRDDSGRVPVAKLETL